MADPLIDLATKAVLRGYLVFGPQSWTSKWWARTRIVIKQLQREQELAVSQAHLAALSCRWQAGSDRQAAAQVQDLLQKIVGNVRPTGRRQGDMLDLAARWYIVNVPDRLRALGIDFGELTPVLN